MLAILLLEARRVVPVERLVELLWDEAPPAGARQRCTLKYSGKTAFGGTRSMDGVPAAAHRG